MNHCTTKNSLELPDINNKNWQQFWLIHSTLQHVPCCALPPIRRSLPHQLSVGTSAQSCCIIRVGRLTQSCCGVRVEEAVEQERMARMVRKHLEAAKEKARADRLSERKKRWSTVQSETDQNIESPPVYISLSFALYCALFFVLSDRQF